jgi:hypothetical protein
LNDDGNLAKRTGSGSLFQMRGATHENVVRPSRFYVEELTIGSPSQDCLPWVLKSDPRNQPVNLEAMTLTTRPRKQIHNDDEQNKSMTDIGR